MRGCAPSSLNGNIDDPKNIGGYMFADQDAADLASPSTQFTLDAFDYLLG
jgi:hypothetical protein